MRRLPLEDFFVGYRQTALASDEVIASITLPKLWQGEVFFCDKLSKRRDQDISTVAAGYRLRLHDGKIEDVRVGFGGMAAMPKRALRVEHALNGQAFSAAAFEAAATAIGREFQPIDDWRGSAAYRLQAAANLLRRLYLRISEPESAVEVEAL
jgi:xanthine dehydrogenase small subunit